MSAQQSFLHMLLTTYLVQQRALLATVTDQQVGVISEIAYNLPRLTDLGPHKKFITYLGNQEHSLRYKKSLIRKHTTRVRKALNPWKKQLLELLD